MTEHIKLSISDPERFDKIVHGKDGVRTVPDAGDLEVVTKDKATESGRSIAVLTFTVDIDGKPARAQTVTTVRCLMDMLKALQSDYDDGKRRPSGAKFINPDSSMSGQLSAIPDWDARLLGILVNKLQHAHPKYEKGVTLSLTDISSFKIKAENGHRLLTHGHTDSISLKIVSSEEAQRLAEFDAAQKGSA